VEQGDQILNVQEIAALLPLAREPEIALRSPETVGEHPELKATWSSFPI
jgi:hypothetical protein